MGCDIHSMVEVYDYDVDGEWSRLNAAVFKSAYYNPDRPVDRWNTPYTSTPLSSRDYDLFALLADVRNYSGIKPVFEPRGIPADASPEWHRYADDDGDLHSASWITLKELMEVEWTQTVKRHGVVTGPTYEAWRDHGIEPDSWSGGVGGAGIRTVTPEQYDAGERAPLPDDPELGMFGARTYVILDWPSTINIGEWVQEEVIPALIRIAPVIHPESGDYLRNEDGRLSDAHPRKTEDVRIVYSFDN